MLLAANNGAEKDAMFRTLLHFLTFGFLYGKSQCRDTILNICKQLDCLRRKDNKERINQVLHKSGNG